MLSKEEIVKIIESDPDYSECGDFYERFSNNALDMRHKYDYSEDVREANASPEKEVSWDCRMTTTTIRVMADDDLHLLVKETLSDWNGTRIQWWLLDKASLTGDAIWVLNDR